MNKTVVPNNNKSISFIYTIQYISTIGSVQIYAEIHNVSIVYNLDTNNRWNKETNTFKSKKAISSS